MVESALQVAQHLLTSQGTNMATYCFLDGEARAFPFVALPLAVL